MHNISTIFRRELASYFATPLAYVFIVIFLVMAGVLTFFVGNLVTANNSTVQTADDFMTFFEGGMGAENSEKEQRSKSHRILTGKITRAKRGEW